MNRIICAFFLTMALAWPMDRCFSQKSKPGGSASHAAAIPVEKKKARVREQYKPAYEEKEKVTYGKPNAQYSTNKPSFQLPETNAFYFSEAFNGNVNDWRLGNDSFRELRISGGYLTANGLKNFNHQCLKRFDIDTQKDFYCSVNVKWISGKRTSRFGIRYCAAEEPCNDFGITADGKFEVATFHDYAWKNLEDPAVLSFINKGSKSNKLSIEKKGNYISFFVNDRQVSTQRFDYNFGNGFGFTFSDAQNILFDDFVLIGTKK